jgi:hypothetical protein
LTALDLGIRFDNAWNTDDHYAAHRTIGNFGSLIMLAVHCWSVSACDVGCHEGSLLFPPRVADSLKAVLLFGGSYANGLSSLSMNRAVFNEKLTDVQRNVEQLLAQLQATEHDKFVAHLYQARKQYRLVCERPNKGTKAVEREVIASYRIAQTLDSRGTSARGSTCCGFTSETRSAKAQSSKSSI